MKKACVCASAIILFSFLILPSASAAEMPCVDGVEYNTSASAEIQIKPSSSVSSVIVGNTYYGVSQTRSDWDMGDGTVYLDTKEVEHAYKDGKYLITVSSEETWNAEVLISENKENIMPLVLMAAGCAIIIICVCRGIPDKIGIVTSAAGIALLASSVCCMGGLL